MKQPAMLLMIFLTPLFLTGCGILYTNVRAPYEYRSATPGDVHADKADPQVVGTACSYSLLYLVAWGDAGYAASTEKALAANPGGFLYDAKADIKITSVLLGLYTKSCTVMTGKVARS